MEQLEVTGLPSALHARFGHIHMAGVCGVGMAGLAVLLRGQGFRVTGCDAQPGPLAKWLADHDIDVQTGHDPRHWDGTVDLFVRSAAVADDNPEVLQARELGIPVSFRGEILPAFVARGHSIAVSGTHGKTTTTAFAAQLLVLAGHDPSWCVGGECEALCGVAHVGGGAATIVEADESDGTVAGYCPETAIITNVEFDHMEHFADRSAFEACFRSLVDNARRSVVYCDDDPVARRLCRQNPKALSYGFSPRADLRAMRLSEKPGEQRFTVRFRGETLGRVVLPVHGRHNVLNALAAIGAVMEQGVSFDDIAAVMPRLRLPRRRFERIAVQNGISVISDYAHHPSEIAALMKMVSVSESGRVLAVFQPHRYTRTAALGAQFPAAFGSVDALVLLPVYAASECRAAGGTVWDLYRHFRSAWPSGPMVSTDLTRAWEFLKRNLRAGDLLLVVGAGDVEQIAAWAGQWLHGGIERGEPGTSELGKQLRQSTVTGAEPLAGRTTLGVGGSVDVWVDVASQTDLKQLCRWTCRHDVPLRILGGGSNVLVSDLGVRGVAARLTGTAFSEIREIPGGVAAGASVPLAKLLDWAQQHGKAGLEFLEGIPGTVGGALRMNAGAWGEEIGARVASVRCVARDGSERELTRAELGFGYRACVALESTVVLEAALVLDAGSAEEIAGQRAAAAERRQWLRGMRTAGSIFRNPTGQSAGRLLDACGMKGVRSGGAVVHESHANVIRTEPGATSADVQSLLEIGRLRVAEKYGIQLETEIVLWE